MKKKFRISTTAALMWRISVLVLGLWLAAMCYLTAMVAKQEVVQYEQYIDAFTNSRLNQINWQGATIDKVMPDWEGQSEGKARYEMLQHAANFDAFATTQLSIPLYKNPYEDASFADRYNAGELRYDTALIFLDQTTADPVFSGDNYAYFTYETPDGMEYAYIDMDKNDWGRLMKKQHSGIPLGSFELYDYSKERILTGYFEGSEFMLYSMVIRHSDRTEEKILQTSQPPADKELIEVHAESLYYYCWDSASITVGEKEYANLGQMVIENSLSLNEDPDNLLQAVVMGLGEYTNTSGGTYWYIAAVRCYPLRTAMVRLANLYWITLLPLIGILALVWWRIRRSLTDSLWQLMDSGKKLQKLPHRHKELWWEPHELEEGYTTLQQDVHALETENARLQTALEYAQNAESYRRQMVSNITHELKTPLAVIHSYAEGLQEGIAPQKQAQYLQIILEETRRMDAMVLEMLDLSRLEAGKVRLATDSVSLNELVGSVTGRLMPLAREKDLHISYPILETVTVTADEGRIGQAITNLVSNAIKYTPEGGNIAIKLLASNGLAIFAIENQCENLSEEDLQRVWESFYRADPSRTTKGTGLGLAITKAIIELHRGTCTVQNTSTGVEFRFALPM